MLSEFALAGAAAVDVGVVAEVSGVVADGVTAKGAGVGCTAGVGVGCVGLDVLGCTLGWGWVTGCGAGGAGGAGGAMISTRYFCGHDDFSDLSQQSVLQCPKHAHVQGDNADNDRGLAVHKRAVKDGGQHEV